MIKWDKKMETIVKLNHDDIQKIIAKHFKVANLCQVKVIPYTATEGYGIDEHIVTKVKAEVSIDDDIEL